MLGPVAPAPNAEALYSKAIEKEGKREVYYRARAWARMCSGNLGAAEADLKAAAKIGQPRAKGDASDSVCLASIDTTVRDENLLRQMAGAQQQQVVSVTVFLNERWIPLRGWSSGHLLPTDRDVKLVMLSRFAALPVSLTLESITIADVQPRQRRRQLCG